MVPCHRVLASDGSIGGFAGSVGECELVNRKVAMLKAEGIEFEVQVKAINKDPKYRQKVIMQQINSVGTEKELEDQFLAQI